MKGPTKCVLVPTQLVVKNKKNCGKTGRRIARQHILEKPLGSWNVVLLSLPGPALKPQNQQTVSPPL